MKGEGNADRERSAHGKDTNYTHKQDMSIHCVIMLSNRGIQLPLFLLALAHSRKTNMDSAKR